MGKVSKLGISVPHTLSENNKDHISLKADPFLKNIITGDEKWVCYVQLKRQWIDKNESVQPYLKTEHHGRKVNRCV